MVELFIDRKLKISNKSSIIYWILSLSNLIPEISIDQEPKVSVGFAIINNLLLVALFGIQHSIMARPWFKELFAKYFPKPIELTPVMTITHLAFAVGLTIYVLIGTRLEEKDLLKTFGEQYKKYQAEKPMLIPFTKKSIK